MPEFGIILVKKKKLKYPRLCNDKTYVCSLLLSQPQ